MDRYFIVYSFSDTAGGSLIRNTVIKVPKKEQTDLEKTINYICSELKKTMLNPALINFWKL